DCLPSLGEIIQSVAHLFVGHIGRRPLLVFPRLLDGGSKLLDGLCYGAESLLERMNLGRDHLLGGSLHKVVKVLTKLGPLFSSYETWLRCRLPQKRCLCLLSHAGQERLRGSQLVRHRLEPLLLVLQLGLQARDLGVVFALQHLVPLLGGGVFRGSRRGGLRCRCTGRSGGLRVETGGTEAWDTGTGGLWLETLRHGRRRIRRGGEL